MPVSNSSDLYTITPAGAKNGILKFAYGKSFQSKVKQFLTLLKKRHRKGIIFFTG